MGREAQTHSSPMGEQQQSQTHWDHSTETHKARANTWACSLPAGHVSHPSGGSGKETSPGGCSQGAEWAERGSGGCIWPLLPGAPVSVSEHLSIIPTSLSICCCNGKPRSTAGCRLGDPALLLGAPSAPRCKTAGTLGAMMDKGHSLGLGQVMRG